jgi:hypothetical protein
MTNKYPGKCSSCGSFVGAGAGQAVKSASGKWEVRCAAHGGGEAPTQTTSRTITVERIGRRSYLRGDTIAVRGLLRDGGCHWDADQTAWWIGSHEEALALAERARTAPAEAPPRKRITHCVGCGCSLDQFQVSRGFKFCSSDCVNDRRLGGQSGYVNGVWHQGSDD